MDDNMNDSENEIHPDIDVMLMDHIDYAAYIKDARAGMQSMNEFIKEKETQYKSKDN
jgi:hypothetical protein